MDPPGKTKEVNEEPREGLCCLFKILSPTPLLSFEATLGVRLGGKV